MATAYPGVSDVESEVDLHDVIALSLFGIHHTVIWLNRGLWIWNFQGNFMTTTLL